jgi:hypothetical protein
VGSAHRPEGASRPVDEELRPLEGGEMAAMVEEPVETKAGVIPLAPAPSGSDDLTREHRNTDRYGDGAGRSDMRLRAVYE